MAENRQKETFPQQLYRHLMEGVNSMLPFTVAGGLFIALAFLIDTLAGAPQDTSLGTYTAAANFFKTVGGFTMGLLCPVLAGHIAMSIAGKSGFLVGMAGGWLAATGSTFADISGGVPSGFLGALIAGFAGGYMMVGIEILCKKVPKAIEGIKPILIFPLAGLLAVSVVMCAVNPVMGWVNTGISDLLSSMGSSGKLLLGAVLGAMMSIDMGGPLNKAAYVFGTAAITSGNYEVMASVMLGGMVPPLVIALSTTFFRSRWTAEERKNGLICYILGLSFITEGAIPYAASDPLRVIPSCAVGAATAGALSMAFGCTLMAPHGGIFVIAVVGRPLCYLISLVSGAAVGMLMLAVLKKKLK